MIRLYASEYKQKHLLPHISHGRCVLDHEKRLSQYDNIAALYLLVEIGLGNVYNR